MKANLSIVLDDKGMVRYDLISNASLEEIDAYTTTKVDHNEIRADFQEVISEFLKEQEDFVQTFKRDANKKGRIVITYQDVNDPSRYHKVRVLYQEQVKKLNPKYTLDKIVQALKNENDLNLTIRLIYERSFIFGSGFANNEVRNAKRNQMKGAEAARKANSSLIHYVVKNTLLHALQEKPEKGYFYIRKVDGYLEQKEKLITTPPSKKPKKKSSKEVCNLQIGDITPLSTSLNHSSISKEPKVSNHNPVVRRIMQEHIDRGEKVSLSDIALEYAEQCSALFDEDKYHR